MENFNRTDLRYLEAQKQVKRMKGFYIHAIVYVLVNIFIIFSNAVLDHQGFGTMDNYWTAVFWGIGLVAHGCGVFVPNFIFGKRWEEQKIEDLMRQNR